MSGRLDDEKLETLRSWGSGLAAEGRDEVGAAGKAILILVEEIEQLQVDIWHAQVASSEATRPVIAPGQDPESLAERSFASADPAARLDSTLTGRVRRLLGHRSLNSR